jgi:hypothetical protein
VRAELVNVRYLVVPDFGVVEFSEVRLSGFIGVYSITISLSLGWQRLVVGVLIVYVGRCI